MDIPISYVKKNINLLQICIALSMFTSSFDIFLNINILEYNFRFTQFIILPVLLCYTLNCLYRHKFNVSIGGLFLILWFVIQSLFIFRSPDITNAIQYSLYLLFDILLVFSVAFFCNNQYSFMWLLRTYMNSFAFVAMFGLIQFMLYPFDINLLVTQHWTNSLARINGFSYEPSYFSTYMLMGFVLFAYLFEKKENDIIKHFNVKFIIIILAMILSTSRMGWLMMLFWITLRIAISFKSIYNGINKKKFICTVFLGLLFLFFLICVIAFLSENTFLLNGLGLKGMASHSVDQRLNGLFTCLDIFLDNPLAGYSLGGVDPIIYKYRNEVYFSGENGSAMSIIGEILISGGIIGLIPFFTYVVKLIFPKTIDNISDKKLNVLYALIWSFIFEMAILCMNQNILRPYVWIQIAVLSSAYKYIYNQNKTSI